ncbi:uncharacterized protein BHQ10_002862 [Talaromyces amestolkiae]|uniref:Erythromycin biosynthesis protein CIII-like C-terminal domain-containing protein n=1 Tax=Talaromyces amestolkiae TaxID=1196081 RepID=A0A364KTG6_TALAM|nr:uncharacterized protein BHQ10_002862 [Talaromyces amestolkiae]RAO66850.1 hypothetical protein BHQ10_002862 [Talaromyces amestolkiae]
MPEISVTFGIVLTSVVFAFLGSYLRAHPTEVQPPLATVQALLERHPFLDIHFASAQSVAKSLDRISTSARKSGDGRTKGNIVFHTLPGMQPMEVLMQRQFGSEVMVQFRHAPGSRGAKQLYKIAQASLSPWTSDEYVRIYNETLRIIDEIDPALVVLDFAFRPAIDATHKRNRLHTFLTPTSLIDMLPMIQPQLNVLWKYPIVGTDFPFPIPWKNIPENIYVALRAIISFGTMSDLDETKKSIAKHGIDNAFGALNNNSTSWIMQTMLEAGPTVDPIPDNVVCVNPIVSSVVTAFEQDPDLFEWLQKASTIMTGVQVLWKFGQAEYIDEARLYLKDHIDQGRVRIYNWLSASPVSLLETGYISVSVHHGGANCYNEALSAGVPQIVIPMWTDLYNYAQRVESIGVGIYATRGTAPEWTVKGISDAFLQVIDGGPKSSGIRARAKYLGDVARKNPGKYAAANLIASLARTNNVSNAKNSR